MQWERLIGEKEGKENEWNLLGAVIKSSPTSIEWIGLAREPRKMFLLMGVNFKF